MRWLLASIWIVSLMLVQTYTAKIAATINASKMDSKVNNLHDLVNQDKIKFGTVKGGATATYLAEIQETDYIKATNKMKNTKPDPFTANNDLGVERVKLGQGKYAFLMETTSMEYNTWKFCELRKMGETFGEKHYGIAMPHGEFKLYFYE